MVSEMAEINQMAAKELVLILVLVEDGLGEETDILQPLYGES